MTEARRGFFPFVKGDQVSIQQAGGVAFVAKDNLQISQGGGQLIGAGNSIAVSQGGSWVMGAGGNVSIDQGGAGIVAAREVRADRSFLGVAVGREVTLTDSRVLVGSVGSLALGLATGLIAGWLFARRAGAG